MSAAKIAARIIQQIHAIVTLPATSYPAATEETDRQVIVSDFDVNASHDETTTPAPVNIVCATFEIPGPGTYTLDLTAAPILGAESGGAPAAAEDITGQRLYAWKFEAPSTNAAAVTIQPAAVNGYELFGASGQIDLNPDSHASHYDRSLPTIAAAARYVEFVGTAGDVLRVVALTETP